MEQSKNMLAWVTAVCLVLTVASLQWQYRTVVTALVLGVVGTLFIFFTEIGYTYRKNKVWRFGNLRFWLRAHIFTGIVGPLVILWHTGFNFYGFAGWLTALTAVVVLSGLFGRYIYRQIPRSIKGQKLSLAELDEASSVLDEKIEQLLEVYPQGSEVAAVWRSQFADREAPDEMVGLMGFFRHIVVWRFSVSRARRLLAAKAPAVHDLAEDLVELHAERALLAWRISLLNVSRILLSQWRAAHIPLTLGLLMGIMIHVAGVFYYGRMWTQ